MTYKLQTKEYEGYVEVQLYGIAGEDTESIDEELILYRNNVKIYAQRVTTTIEANKRNLLYTFDDLYCGLGVPCAYSVKKIEQNSTQQIANTQLIAMSEGAFLSSFTGTVLPVKFDLNIANYKYNIADSITPTLGGIYPFIRRNGNQRYRTFTLNGLISYHQEELNGLISYHQEEPPKHGLYLTVNNEFKNSYSGAGALSESEADRIKEKLYRDAVIHFLQDNTIKLFRSLEEGSIFVHLSNINLTPKTELGRLIYSFSCTATECREYSDEALSKWLKEGEDTHGAI